jgi:hypothetical protein
MAKRSKVKQRALEHRLTARLMAKGLSKTRAKAMVRSAAKCKAGVQKPRARAAVDYGTWTFPVQYGGYWWKQKIIYQTWDYYGQHWCWGWWYVSSTMTGTYNVTVSHTGLYRC